MTNHIIPKVVFPNKKEDIHNIDEPISITILGFIPVLFVTIEYRMNTICNIQIKE